MVFSEIAVLNWEFWDVEEMVVLDDVSQLLPPLGHEAVAVLEEVLQLTRLIVTLAAAKRDDFKDISSSELCLFRHPDRGYLHELHHLSSHSFRFHNRPSKENQQR